MPDDAELLEIVTPAGAGTGRLVTRAQVHREGAWHRTRSVWVVLQENLAQPALVLQKRGSLKEAFPGLLDASSAGHLTAHDTDPWREVEEELGLRPVDADVVRLGVRRSVARLPEGRVDRELQELWLWLCPHELGEFRLPVPEVAAVLAVPLDSLRGLLRGDFEHASARVRWAGGGTRAPVADRLTVRLADFIPGSGPYVAHIVELGALAVAGRRRLAYDPAFDTLASGG